jgi:hypothetical protein
MRRVGDCDQSPEYNIKMDLRNISNDRKWFQQREESLNGRIHKLTTITEIKIQVAIFRVVTPCSVAAGYIPRHEYTHCWGKTTERERERMKDTRNMEFGIPLSASRQDNSATCGVAHRVWLCIAHMHCAEETFVNNFWSDSRNCETLKKVKVKINLSLCLTKHHAMKTYWGVEL